MGKIPVIRYVSRKGPGGTGHQFIFDSLGFPLQYGIVHFISRIRLFSSVMAFTKVFCPGTPD